MKPDQNDLMLAAGALGWARPSQDMETCRRVAVEIDNAREAGRRESIATLAAIKGERDEMAEALTEIELVAFGAKTPDGVNNVEDVARWVFKRARAAIDALLARKVTT